jgi:hypothetical protein
MEYINTKEEPLRKVFQKEPLKFTGNIKILKTKVLVDAHTNKRARPPHAGV